MSRQGGGTGGDKLFEGGGGSVSFSKGGGDRVRIAHELFIVKYKAKTPKSTFKGILFELRKNLHF